jgi:hypothetical protein
MIVFIYKWRKKWRFPHISAPLITVTAATPASPLWMTGNSVSIYWLQCGKRLVFYIYMAQKEALFAPGAPLDHALQRFQLRHRRGDDRLLCGFCQNIRSEVCLGKPNRAHFRLSFRR